MGTYYLFHSSQLDDIHRQLVVFATSDHRAIPDDGEILATVHVDGVPGYNGFSNEPRTIIEDHFKEVL